VLSLSEINVYLVAGFGAGVTVYLLGRAVSAAWAGFVAAASIPAQLD
jgi:hypothetical protein